MKIDRILLTTDFSDAARSSYAATASLGTKFGSSIEHVHVVEALPPHLYLNTIGIYTDLPQEPRIQELERLLDEEAKNDAFGGAEVATTLLYHGSPPEAVVHHAREEKVDLLVTSAKGHSSFAYLFLGSFTQKLVRLAPAPVLTTRLPATPAEAAASSRFEPQRIIVPFDFSDNAHAVLPLARALATEFGAKLLFAYATHGLPNFADMPLWSGYSAEVIDMVQEAPSAAQERFEKVRSEHLRGIDAELEVLEGEPGNEVCEYAKRTGAELILLTTHGWTGFKHLLLGSVAERIVHRAPCSVLTVRNQPRDDDEDRQGEGSKGKKSGSR